MKFQVAFCPDPTGMGQDITDTIELPEETCLFCCCDHSSSRFPMVIKREIAAKHGYAEHDIHLLKVYIAKD